MRSFQKENTLMPQDLEVTTESLQGQPTTFIKLKVRCPKEWKAGRSKHTWVELFEHDTFWCPIKAIAQYLRTCHPNPPADQPLIRRQDGSGYTSMLFNGDIRQLLKGSFDYCDQRILSHSFR